MPEFLTKQRALEELSNMPPELDKMEGLKILGTQYEIEGYNAEFSPFEAVKNIPESTKEFGKAIWTAISKPGQTIKAISSLAKGGLSKLGVNVKQVTGESWKDEEQLFDGMVDFFIERYGSKDKILNTVEIDPLGFLADSASLLGGAGLGIRGVSMGGKVKILQRAGGSFQKISRALEPTTAATKTIRKFNEFSGINKAIRSSSARFMAKATGLSKAVRKNIAEATHLGKDPTIWMAEHGISGTLDGMFKQLTSIERKTVSTVDNLLASVDKTYKTDSATKFLTGLRNAFGKTTEDIVEGFDVLTTKQGKTKLIPYKQKESVFLPFENMSKKMATELGEIQGLLDKSKTTGLTLTELNKVKRLGDNILNIFDRAGEVKAQRTAQNLGNLRAEIREFIEQSAKQEGIPDIQKLNQQTQVSMLLKENMNDLLIATETRSAIGDQLIFLMGLTGSAATVSGAPLLGAAVVVGGREIVRLPRVRSFIGTRLRLMSDGDYQNLLRGIKTGKKSKAVKDIIRRERKLLQKTFPELRLAGIAQQKQE